jgi:hypothetical protein
MSTAEPYQEPLTKPVAGLAFVGLWAVAIVAWSVSPLMADPRWGAFIIDAGIVLAALGFAALFIPTADGLGLASIAAIVGIALFLLFDLLDVPVLVFTLRIFIPLLALLTPVNRLIRLLF